MGLRSKIALIAGAGEEVSSKGVVEMGWLRAGWLENGKDGGTLLSTCGGARYAVAVFMGIDCMSGGGEVLYGRVLSGGGT